MIKNLSGESPGEKSLESWEPGTVASQFALKVDADESVTKMSSVKQESTYSIHESLEIK